MMDIDGRCGGVSIIPVVYVQLYPRKYAVEQAFCGHKMSEVDSFVHKSRQPAAIRNSS